MAPASLLLLVVSELPLLLPFPEANPPSARRRRRAAVLDIIFNWDCCDCVVAADVDFAVVVAPPESSATITHW